MNLFEIAGQYKGLMLMADDLPEDALTDTLESITDDFETKGMHITHVIKNFDTTAIDKEIHRLQAMKTAITNRKQRLKDYLRSGMVACGITKIEWDTGGVTLGKAKPMVVIDDESLVPKKYKKTIPATTQIVKADLLKAVKKGSVLGAHLGESEQSLLIK